MSDLKSIVLQDGTSYRLGARLGTGGEGEVYTLPGYAGKAVKLYRTDRRSGNSPSLEQRERKLRAIIRRNVSSKLGSILAAAIPEQLVYDENGMFRGCLMPRIYSRLRFYDICRTASRERYFPYMTYRHLALIAYNLAEILEYLHCGGIVVGDLNPNNIAVNADGTLCLMDMDSCTVTDPETGEEFRTGVGLAEMLAPELQKCGDLGQARFSACSDDFSLAIMIFSLLSCNHHPFGGFPASHSACVSAQLITVANEILNGNCPYFRNLPDRVPQDCAYIIGALPDYVRRLFQRAFDYSSETIGDNIRSRPSAGDWGQAMARLYNEPQIQCPRDRFHVYPAFLNECPLCRQRLESQRKLEQKDQYGRRPVPPQGGYPL